MERQYPTSLPSSLENIFKKVGFKGGVMLYSIVGDELSSEDFLYLTIDYVARVCWAFHSQGQIDFLRVYKEAFFDFSYCRKGFESTYISLFNRAIVRLS